MTNREICARMFIWLAIVLFTITAGEFVVAKARAQGYLPPRHEAPRQQPPAQADPLEYYAEDWIVLDSRQQTVCKDPYIRRDVKIIQCISDEKVK